LGKRLEISLLIAKNTTKALSGIERAFLLPMKKLFLAAEVVKWYSSPARFYRRKFVFQLKAPLDLSVVYLLVLVAVTTSLQSSQC
jgi:hypothetical protein